MGSKIYMYTCEVCKSNVDFVSSVVSTEPDINCPACETLMKFNGSVPDMTNADFAKIEALVKSINENDAFSDDDDAEYKN